MTGVDEATQTPLAISVPSKESNVEYTIESIKTFIRIMSYPEVRVRVDCEPALVAILDKVKDQLLAESHIKVNLELAPRYSSQSMGAVGAAQRALHEQVRCLKTDVEERYGKPIDPSQALWPWLVRRAAWAVERYKA